MEPSLSNSTRSRDVLIDMIKTQLDDDSRDQDSRRDAFLCLAVTIPERQRARIKGALESLLTEACIRGSCRDSEPNEDPQDLQVHHNDFELAAQLERTIGVVSTLLVMGCKSTLVSGVVFICVLPPFFFYSPPGAPFPSRECRLSAQLYCAS